MQLERVVPAEDESAAILADMVRSQRQFVFTKMGDAEIQWIFRIGGCAAEGDIGIPEYGEALREGWVKMGRSRNLFVGDWQTASFGTNDPTRYPEQYAALCAMLENEPTYLHYESILLMRESRYLLGFYDALKQDPRRKLLVGPERLADAAAMLGCQRHVTVPLWGACGARHDILAEIRQEPFDVGLFCCGRTAKMLMGELVDDSLTLIDLGSAMDPLYVGKTRSQQLPEDVARRYFAEIL